MPISVSGVFSQLFNDLERDGGDIGSKFCSVQVMERVANAGHNDLGIEQVVGIDFHDLFHEVHTHVSNVIESSYERAHVGRSRLCGHQGLQG